MARVEWDRKSVFGEGLSDNLYVMMHEYICIVSYAVEASELDNLL